MEEKKPNLLQAGFWLTHQEKIYLLVICGLFILGLAARYLYLNNRHPTPSLGSQPEQVEKSAQKDAF